MGGIYKIADSDEQTTVLLTLQRLIRNPSERSAAPPHQQIEGRRSFADKPVPEEYRSSVKTLQGYRDNSDPERTAYMENHSTLNPKGLAISVEQVSIFLQSDNTVVSFFEHSADVIEEPILTRLKSAETILRTSGDASMIMHAIIDGIVDLAIPCTAAYEHSIAELELDVLIDPSIRHSKDLYVLLSDPLERRPLTDRPSQLHTNIRARDATFTHRAHRRPRKRAPPTQRRGHPTNLRQQTGPLRFPSALC